MRVLTLYAHPDRRSFCHAVLQEFGQGLAEAGHTNDVLDLYATRFDPVLRTRDFRNYLPDANAPDVAERFMRERILGGNAGPIQRVVARTLLRNKSPVEAVGLLRRRGPRDVRRHQERVARAEGLAFISPLWVVGFPAILKGWIERVLTLGFAFSLTSDGWRGDLDGRVPLLRHQKALIISTTLFNEESYRAGLGEAMRRLHDEFALQYRGIRNVEHVYFYAVSMADQATLQGYLRRAHQLGREFAC
jgi:NAD(P)H dehydrogenase (quinone)